MYWRKEFYAAELGKPVDRTRRITAKKSTEKEKQ